jgi:hypothetical protein
MINGGFPPIVVVYKKNKKDKVVREYAGKINVSKILKQNTLKIKSEVKEKKTSLEVVNSI